MNSKIKLKRNVYLILQGVILLAAAVQATHSDFILQFGSNDTLKERAETWKPKAADPSFLQPSGKPYCVVYDSKDDFSSRVGQQIGKVLQYMKKNVMTADVQDGGLSLDSCSAVISAVSELGLLGNPNALADYVKKGGYVFQTVHPEIDDTFYRLYRKMGMVGTGKTLEAPGIELTENVLIGEKGLRIRDHFILNTSIEAELDPRSRLLARSDNGIPLLWDFPYGQGKFMMFNGTILQEKIQRGLLAGAVSLLEPDTIYPIFNSKLFYIDDFPAPVSKLTDKVIYEEYHRDRPAFFKEIWWPDMIKLAKRDNLKYTAVLIESYNDRVEPPFASPDDADPKGLISYGREVIKSGGEIGLHGYNHQSLQTDPEIAEHFTYNAWNGPGPMAEAIAEAFRFMGSAFPNYRMITYVPPSNVLSPEGREALKQAWPDLAVISSLYADDAYGRSYVQEFEIAPDGIMELPRVTAGYVEDSYLRWTEANAMTAHGIISHFIHPDDLLSPDRNHNLSWEKLYEKFGEMLDRQERTYPWLRPMTASEAAAHAEHLLNSRVDWTRGDNRIAGSIKPFRENMYFILRSNKSIKSLTRCAAQKIDDGVYLITANQADFEIGLGD